MDNEVANAVAAIEGYKNNKIIMDFVENEAHEKVAAEISAKPGYSTTAKGVALSACRKGEIADRVNQYIAAGLVGCYMASLEIAA